MTNRQKQAGTVIGMGILWGFWLLPTAEDLPDAQPATPLEWKLFIALNFAAIIYLHILNVGIAIGFVIYWAFHLKLLKRLVTEKLYTT